MRSSSVLAVLLTVCVCASARATVLYFNGFEPGDPGTADFFDTTTGAQGGDITIVANGGGTLGLTAPTGGHYAEITNVDDAYSTNFGVPAGYGDSNYTTYGHVGTNPGNGIAIGGPFLESAKYYINVNWAAASANGNFAGFWIDTTPSTDPGSLDETNFRIIDTGNGTIGVNGFAGNPGTNGLVADITTSGWYTFQTTFQDSGGFVSNDLSVINSLGVTIGSFTGVTTLPFADLTGTNYGDWTTVWENGFAGDTLGIDDVTVASLRSTSTPLPASFWCGMLLMAAVGGRQLLRRKRRALV